MDASELAVVEGHVTLLRLFDVAYAIDLGAVEALWTRHAGSAISRGRFRKAPAKAVAFDVPPVQLSLGSHRLRIDGREHVAGVSARVYDFGVMALAVRVPVADIAWADYVRLHEAVDQQLGAAADAAPWQDWLQSLTGPLRPAMTRHNVTALQEDYFLAVVNQWSEPLSAVEVEARVDLVPLLSGEQRPLSAAARHDLLRQRFSYYEDDLVVLTWDRAFIYEPRGDSDVADVLEVANAQLLELRYYDELLDDELPRMYDLVESTRSRLPILSSPYRYAGLARRLYTLVAEVTELTEKVDNALQVTEDVYLARVYSSAIELFRVRTVGNAVDRKLAIIRDTYSALFDESSSARGALMELTIVVLILFEIVLALAGH